MRDETSLAGLYPIDQTRLPETAHHSRGTVIAEGFGQT